MKKQFFVWKDGKQNKNGVQEWTEINGKDFLEICKSNFGKPIEERRLFARISGSEDDDIYYVFECDYENYLKSNAECVERFRKRLDEEQLKIEGLWYELVSLDYTMTDECGEEYTLHDIVPDPDAFFENKAITSVDLERALSNLQADEKAIVEALYLSNRPKTVREYAEELKIPHTTLQSRKKNILKKIKKSFVQN